MKSFGSLVLVACLLLIAVPFAQAQMKTPNPLERGGGEKAAEPAEPKDEAKEAGQGEATDDYYEEEQAGGIHYEEEAQVLDKETIKDVIDKRQTGILYCYEKELQTNQKLKGRMLVNFTIQLDGAVAEVKLVADKTEIKDKKVTDCVLDIVKSFRFPARKAGEPIEINYPFNFQPKAK
ncbi:MAG: hypothetical protein C4523_15450 [Myxococcales bacterium]|nr:MAG: hypothetical protein C4523_15450 [Myxococcales bacterium]